MAKRNPKSVSVDRSIWMTTLELMKEFGYQDRGSVSNLCTINGISRVKNPESPLPQSLLYNKQEFTAIPAVARRLIDAPEMEKYDKELHLTGDYMLTGDWHIPFHDADLVEKMMVIAKRFELRKLVIVGDFVELDSFKVFLDKTVSWQYEKETIRKIIKSLLSWFVEITWLMGNHEIRMWKRLQGMGEEEDIFQLVLEKETVGKVQYSVYPFSIINSSWMVIHPKSYSRIAARNPYFLASKYLVDLVLKKKPPNGQCGIIAFHGHGGGEATDISGNFQAVDGMCMCDPQKIGYQVLKINTAPRWRPGFMALINNYLYRFPAE